MKLKCYVFSKLAKTRKTTSFSTMKTVLYNLSLLDSFFIIGLINDNTFKR